MKFLKLLILPLILISLISFLALNRPVTASPPDNPVGAVNSIAQSDGVTLEKQASSDQVSLGQIVTYTVTIKNEGRESLNPTLTDALPSGLGLQTGTISATSGLIEADNNVVTWSGNLAAGDEVTLFYSAIPPSTSEAGQTLNNVATLKFGNTTLEAGAAITTQTPDLGIWGSFVNFIALALVFFNDMLESINIPYAFGFAIILFTIVVRLATFPLNMQQIKSSKAMQELQPRMKELQEKYKNDREKLAQEQMALYKEAGVNPLGGCLPTLVQMPIWFALYQALVQLSHEGLLNQGFFWIPSLAGPVTYQNGGLSWLWPLPPSIGWAAALAYLVLPVLLVVSQYYMQQMMTPPNPDPQQASMNSMMKIMPVMFGYFSLIVPSGLTLYWFTSNILALIQQYFTQTSLKPATTPAGAPLRAPVTASPIATNSEENSKDTNVKPKRKSRRKR
ncbi:MAG TPA: membrane protein insertase YidC [Anaerolineae bacterium]|nr:membrane protein insertase YidC [Anaerolineae bacterium]